MEAVAEAVARNLDLVVLAEVGAVLMRILPFLVYPTLVVGAAVDMFSMMIIKEVVELVEAAEVALES